MAAIALAIRADEDEAGFRERGRKRRAFGEEAVSRMHGLGAGLFAGCKDTIDAEIAFGRRRRTNRHRLVRHLDVECVPVSVGVDRYGRDPHPARGLDDPTGNLAAIGDQDPLEHAT